MAELEGDKDPISEDAVAGGKEIAHDSVNAKRLAEGLSQLIAQARKGLAGIGENIYLLVLIQWLGRMSTRVRRQVLLSITAISASDGRVEPGAEVGEIEEILRNAARTEKSRKKPKDLWKRKLTERKR